jgi:hypothetical protein
VGPVLLKLGGPQAAKYVAWQLSLARQALVGAERSKRPAARERAARLAEQVRLLEAALERMGI